MISIALGANLPSKAGAPRETLLAALTALADGGIEIGAVSPFYATPAWPDPRDPAFVNAVARIATGLSPRALMDLLHEVETQFGRKRSARNAPRTLDLDLLDYEGLVQAGPPVLPHPRMADRAFVLVPLADIAPAWRHPVLGESAASLAARLPDAGTITRL
jgi:2-amino-4-hydroxy-6-hydroxymethyldihydropteridine diphosphokinase